MKNVNILISIVNLILFNCSCNKNEFKRPFWQLNKFEFQDYSDSEKNLLSGFKINENSTEVNGKDYFRIQGTNSRIIPFDGFLYFDFSKLLLIDENGLKEQVLFDFKKKIGSSWKIVLRNKSFKITYLSLKLKDPKRPTFFYSLEPISEKNYLFTIYDRIIYEVRNDCLCSLTHSINSSLNNIILIK